MKTLYSVTDTIYSPNGEACYLQRACWKLVSFISILLGKNSKRDSGSPSAAVVLPYCCVLGDRVKQCRVLLCHYRHCVHTFFSRAGKLVVIILFNALTSLDTVELLFQVQITFIITLQASIQQYYFNWCGKWLILLLFICGLMHFFLSIFSMNLSGILVRKVKPIQVTLSVWIC